MAKLSPQEAASELLRRRKARQSLIAYANAIEIPGAPVSDDPDEWLFKPIETTVAKHHEIIMNTLEEVAAGTLKRVMLFLPPGSAKALALDTPIPTPQGWKAMGDLRVGDQVFSETGEPCNVTWVSPVWRNRPVYKVSTDCGDEIIADKDHEWLVRLCGKPSAPNKGLRPTRTRQPFKIKETWELCRKRSKRPMIQKALALQLPAGDLPVDPYLLGVWLGDGNSAGMRVTSSVDDQPWLRGEIERLGYVTSNSSSPTLFGVLGVRGEFVKLGLVNDPAHNTYGRKHIPQMYMRGSQEQRLHLLQGLIDTDGTVCKSRGCTTFCNTNKELALQVRELVRSLGVKAGWSEAPAMIGGKHCGMAYRVSFYLKDAARMPRKRTFTKDQTRTPNTYIDVTEHGTADTVCIEVDSPSHLFLCGQSMTPTHNSTYASIVFPTYYLGKYPKTKIILASYGSDLAKRMGRKARQIVRSKYYGPIFNVALSAETSAADEWALSNESEYMACGILSGVTGNRAQGLLVDDPLRGRQDADSEIICNRTWQAYQDDLLTRLVPGGWQVLIQTRWSDNDLAGRILPAEWSGESGNIVCRDGETWRVVCIQAQCERNDDPVGRQKGEYLWPGWFSESHFAQFKRVPRTWNALYQQVPATEEGDYFKTEHCQWYEKPPKHLRIYGASDYAVTDGGGDFTEHGVFGVDPNDDLYILDWWYGQTTSDVWVEELLDLTKRNKPITWFGEAGVIKRSVEPFLLKRSRERKVYCDWQWLSSITDKPTRARAFQARWSMKKVYLPSNAPWAARLLRQLSRFPAGAEDDGVDVCSLIGRALDEIVGARVPEVEAKRKRDYYEMREEEEDGWKVV